MRYVFGPVPSRRLGQSLGIDPVPLKTCNWNCIYCQLGRSIPMTNERRAYFPRDEILDEAREALAQHDLAKIDWVTFIGSGEPTLNVDLGWLIRQVKSLTDLPVAVCTNGALLYLPEIRQELAAADAVMPTVSAGSAELYWHIHRPYPGLTFERLVEGLLAFRQSYRGNLWPEVMLLRDINDSEEALRDIATLLERIQPDQVHIALPSRPPAETWVQPTDNEGLMRALAILGGSSKVLHPADGAFDLSGHKSVVDAVIEIITRHPMSQADLEKSLARWSPDEVTQALAELEGSGRAQIVERFGINFWSASPAAYPGEEKSQAVSPDRLRPRLRYHQPIPKTDSGPEIE
jgi:wyosine [tRNA(Phe)-imidazoG37] synthetase (radical SAM superfamily)